MKLVGPCSLLRSAQELIRVDQGFAHTAPAHAHLVWSPPSEAYGLASISLPPRSSWIPLMWGWNVTLQNPILNKLEKTHFVI
jgi:hypothetical protein